MIKISKKLQKLENFLLSPAVDEKAMLLTELDGFMAGVILCPENIKEAEWIEKVWGSQQPVFESKAQRTELLSTILERFSEISISFKKGKFKPILEPDLDGSILWEGWVSGFKQAVMLRPASWLIHDKTGGNDGRVSFSLLMRLAELEEGDTEPQEGDEALERDALLLIPHCAEKLFKAKEKLFQPSVSTRSSAVVGRNDPCPCGSGKKFKKCCLN